MEAWLSAVGQPLTDNLALEGIGLIRESLVPLYKGAGGKAEWEKLTWASTLGGRDESDCVAAIKKLLIDIDLTTILGEQGVKAEDIDWMAENTLKVSAAGIANHPIQFGLEEIKEIYRAVL
jgi:alcohol dehydrogenase class IV